MHQQRDFRVRLLRAACVVAVGATSVVASPVEAEGVSYLAIPIPGYEAPDRFAVSADGQVVAFRAIPVDNTRVPQILAYDRRTRRLDVVTRGIDGKPGSHVSDGPFVSADGRYVAFASAAVNLVVGDQNGVTDVFVRDRLRRRTDRVNLRPDGREVSKGATTAPPAVHGISADGQIVLFGGTFSELNGPVKRQDDAYIVGAYIADRRAGSITRVTHPDGRGVQTLGYLALPGDGFSVALATQDPLTRDDRDNCFDVYLFSVRSRHATLVSAWENAEQTLSDTSTGVPIVGGACAAVNTRPAGLNHKGTVVNANGTVVAMTFGVSNKAAYRVMSQSTSAVLNPPPPVTPRHESGVVLTDEGRSLIFLGADSTSESPGNAAYSLDIESQAVTRITGALDNCLNGACTYFDLFDATVPQGTVPRPPVDLAASADGKVLAFSAFIPLVDGVPPGEQTAYIAVLP